MARAVSGTPDKENLVWENYRRQLRYKQTAKALVKKKRSEERSTGITIYVHAVGIYYTVYIRNTVAFL